MRHVSKQPMPWVSQVLLITSWQGADINGGAPKANAALSSQRYNALGRGSNIPSDGTGMVINDVMPATHAPVGGEADAAAGTGSSGVPSNDETQVTQQGHDWLPRQ